MSLFSKEGEERERGKGRKRGREALPLVGVLEMPCGRAPRWQQMAAMPHRTAVPLPTPPRGLSDFPGKQPKNKINGMQALLKLERGFLFKQTPTQICTSLTACC